MIATTQDDAIAMALRQGTVARKRGRAWHCVLLRGRSQESSLRVEDSPSVGIGRDRQLSWR